MGWDPLKDIKKIGKKIDEEIRRIGHDIGDEADRAVDRVGDEIGRTIGKLLPPIPDISSGSTVLTAPTPTLKTQERGTERSKALLRANLARMFGRKDTILTSHLGSGTETRQTILGAG